MKDVLISLIKLVLGILIIMFTEEYFYKLLSFVGISINNNIIVSFIISLIICLLIYFVYKDDLSFAFSRYKYKFSSNLFYSVLTFIILFIAMMIVDYLITALSKGINLNYEGLSFINIFNDKFSLNSVIYLLKDMIIVPFIKVTIFILGVSKLTSIKSANFVSGLLYSLYAVYTMCKFNASISYVLINMIPYFCLFSMLSFINIKNKNITYSIVSFSLYELFASILIARFL